MPLPASIMNLGAPLNATPEVMAALRAEKTRQARIIEDRDRARLLELADYISTHPESLSQARSYVDCFLSSPAHSALHWALREWDEILAERSLSEISDLLRDDSESTRHLRETSPFARPQSASLVNA
jgi:hypothetical protein